MRHLNHQLKQLCRRNQDGSRSTQATRERILTLIANELHDNGYRGLQARSLKPKHVESLTTAWLEAEVSTGTIKNRMSAIRWWAEKVDKRNVVARDNSYYGIADRELVSRISKAKSLDERLLAKITDPNVRMSLRLQQAFGLRREEAIKFMPTLADRGTDVYLKPSWTKGGKERLIPIRTTQQKELLVEAKRLVGRGSLIPSHRKYIHQLRIYERQTANDGLSKMHGPRHAYAQRRYFELTGWVCPTNGGRGKSIMTKTERRIDALARQEVSQELGHERISITNVYLGSK
ncbi:MAG: phage integrase N-terminal domain-containing protein [Lysobacterales bacterium]